MFFIFREHVKATFVHLKAPQLTTQLMMWITDYNTRGNANTHLHLHTHASTIGKGLFTSSQLPFLRYRCNQLFAIILCEISNLLFFSRLVLHFARFYKQRHTRCAFSCHPFFILNRKVTNNNLSTMSVE